MIFSLAIRFRALISHTTFFMRFSLVMRIRVSISCYAYVLVFCMMYIPSLRKSNGFLQPGWVQCSLISIEGRGGCGRYPKHAPKSGFSAIRKECLGENAGNFTVVRVHVVRGYMPICRKFCGGFFALGGLHVSCVLCVSSFDPIMNHYW